MKDELLLNKAALVKCSGLFVVLVGPDGSGKSSIADGLIRQLQEQYSGAWRFHWRPGLFPKLGRATGHLEPGSSTRPDDSPPQVSKYSGIISLLRFAYYWLDFVIGYWIRIVPRKLRRQLIVGERYFMDVVVHPERYGFDVPRWLLAMARRGVPSPDLVILLKADPQVIYSRKPELPLDCIGQQLVFLESELKHWRKSLVIDTEAGIGSTIEEIERQIQVEQGIDEGGSLECRARGSWVPFPARGLTKIWIDPYDSVSNALHLYQPSSRRGRLAKWIVCELPNWISFQFLKRRSRAADNAQLFTYQSVIRDVLSEKQLVTSFYIGAAGKHQKVTSQVSKAGKIVAYVKIGGGLHVKALLERERDCLTEVANLKLDGIVVPEVRHFCTSGDRYFLYLSAPQPPGKPRSNLPDHHDARFLTAMVGQTRRELNVTDGLRECFHETVSARLNEVDPGLAVHVLRAVELATKILHKEGMVMGWSHGDYAPWNTQTLSDSRLYVYDWEYSSPLMPILNDVFHRVMMPSRLVHKLSPVAAMDRLLGMAACPVLGPVIRRAGITEHFVPVYLLLYVIHILNRELDSYGSVSRYLKACLGELLIRMRHPQNRRRILVAAYACEPDQGSEPGVGWHWVQEIAKENETWVITRRNNRSVIEAAQRAAANANLHFEYVDLPRSLTFWKRKQRGVRTYYYLWQFAALARGYSLHRRMRFHLSHHITFVNAWMGTFLALLPGPFVWGPIGTTPRFPAQLLPNLKGRFNDFLRVGIQIVGRSFEPLYWVSLIRASRVVVINHELPKTFPLCWMGKSRLQIESAIGVDRIAQWVERPFSPSIEILFVGRLVLMKGVHLALEAFGLLTKTHPEVNLTLLGSGPEESLLRGRVEERGWQHRVRFVTWQPLGAVTRFMREADIFLFPSMEAAGMVVLEAMAEGLPVVCLDYGGPGAMVPNTCGIKVPVQDWATTVNGLGDAVSRLISNHDLRRNMGKCARAHVEEHHLWSRKAAVVRALYDLVDPCTDRQPVRGETCITSLPSL